MVNLSLVSHISTNYIEQAGFYTYDIVVIIGVEEHHNILITYFIDAPKPNPAVEVHVRIMVCDVSDRLVSTIVDETKTTWLLRYEDRPMSDVHRNIFRAYAGRPFYRHT